MQVFLCWSGAASHAIAKAMATFLGDVVQEVQPFLSSENIGKGGRWRSEIGQRLADCNFGILCLTKDNLESRWILFEAGALSKNITEGRVTALLGGINPTDVEEPLSQFQHTGIEADEILKLLKTINGLLPEQRRLTEERLKRAFDKYWSDLDQKLTEALKPKPGAREPVPTRDPTSMIAETLELVRELKRGSDVSTLLAAYAIPSNLGSGYTVSPLLGDAQNLGALAGIISNPTRELPTGLLGPTLAGSVVVTPKSPKAPSAPVIKPLKT
jgi:hypothetical protein